MVEGGITEMQGGAGGRVSYKAYPGTSRYQSGRSGATPAPPPTTGGGSDLLISLSSGARAPMVPSGGVTGGSDQLDQPTGSLFTLPRARCHFDPEGGKLDLPLLT